MLIKFRGVRGSIAVSGAEYLRYGGDTACIELRGKAGGLVIVDAGTGLRRLGREMVGRGENAARLFLTHAHWDHIMGFPFFLPLYRKDFSLEVMGCPYAQHAVQSMIANTMRAPNFPVEFENISAALSFPEACSCSAGLEAEAIPLSHPNGGNGYAFCEDGKKFVFLTDNELGFRHEGGMAPEDYARACRGADLLVHDADYLPSEYERRRGWGHSTWEMALELAERAGVKSLGLYHHNQDRSDGEIDTIVSECRSRAAGRGLKIDIFAAAQDMEVSL